MISDGMGNEREDNKKKKDIQIEIVGMSIYELE
jgi:hypothetical protein